MLLSMTGYGGSHRQQQGLAVAVEVRTINSRYFKINVRTPDGYTGLDRAIEKVVRQSVRRGTINITIRIHRDSSPEDYRLDTAVLEGYRRQLEELCRRWQLSDSVPLAQVLTLPGVVVEGDFTSESANDDWPVINEALEEAIDRLSAMRSEEGRAMEADLRHNCGRLAAEIGEVERRAPKVVDEYRTKLRDRISKALEDFNTQLEPNDILREVSIFAERSDISEEIVRLRSHVEQFEATIDLPESSGRKLDFLTQEMFREANTIGSKASDVEIARRVVEMKTVIERVREMVQNVE